MANLFMLLYVTMCYGIGTFINDPLIFAFCFTGLTMPVIVIAACLYIDNAQEDV